MLVFIHEGGHYIAARAFGVRVTEFMIGLPGPSIGFTRNGTRFGITAIPLGGYARVCGMESGPMSEHLEDVLAAIYERGWMFAEEVAEHCEISCEDARQALEELVQWGSVVEMDLKKLVDFDSLNALRIEAEDRPFDAKSFDCAFATPEYVPSKREITRAKRLCTFMPGPCSAGERRPFVSKHALFKSELSKQYRNLPFWKRSVILLAGVAVNLLFAVLAMIAIYSAIGIDYTLQSGEVYHFCATPLQSVQIGFECIVLTAQAVIGLFNPQTAAQTVSDSTSVVGIAVMSSELFSRGIADGLFFMAGISISLGIMNLLPIPPLDGGRILIEIVQKVSGRDVPTKVVGYISMAGMALFLAFFVFMLNQDIQRFVFGNW